MQRQHGEGAGRPSKFSTETVEQLTKALADGLTIKQGCLAAGISETTLGRWKAEHPDLVEQLTEAREQARRKALAVIKEAGELGDWRASAEFLKLSFPEYRQPGTKVEVKANAQAGTVVVTEEKRRELQKQLREIMEEDYPLTQLSHE